MGQVLQRASDLGGISKGQYTVTADGRTVVSCPACERWDILDEIAFTISRAGVVSPRWACPDPACGLIEWLLLDAWRS